MEEVKRAVPMQRIRKIKVRKKDKTAVFIKRENRQ